MKLLPNRVARAQAQVVAQALTSLSAAAAAAALGAWPGIGVAQEYSGFLSCSGSFTADDKTRNATADLALRVNNRTALVQGSNVLPVGEVMHYVPTPATYSMTYLLRPRGTRVYAIPGWFQNTILMDYPNLQRLNQIRMSVNRQTGVLQGKLLNEEDKLLGEFQMQCSAQTEQGLPPPKF